jgi:SAM-dependent methyltransferase
MMEGAVRVLVCPRCGSDVAADGVGLRCAGGHTIPVVRGIPRLIGRADDSQRRTRETFGYQWTQFEVTDAAEDIPVLEAKIGKKLTDLAGALVLDAGCGSGRYARLAGEAGASVVGIDVSDAVEKARAQTAHLSNVAIVQGDLLDPPLKPASFDVVYSIGVLHHTPSTARAFERVARLVKPGGYLAVWLYRRNTLVQEVLNGAARAVTTRLPIRALRIVARAGAVAGGIPAIRHLNKVLNFSAHPRWETRVCDTFDWYAPPYQYHHSEQELVAWFAEAGFSEIRVLNSQPSKGALYAWVYRHNLLIGSGVNVAGVRRAEATSC